MSIEGFEQDVTARKSSTDRRDEQIKALREALRERDGGGHDPDCRIRYGRECTCGHDDAIAALALTAPDAESEHPRTGPPLDVAIEMHSPSKGEPGYRAPQPERDGGWRSMDSAPRAWQSIMLHEPDAERNNEVGEGYFDGAESDPGVGENCWKWADGTQAFPTRWRPLPAPPTSTEAEGEG